MTTHDPYILIVEDEPHIAHLLEVNLQLEAYLSMTTETAKEAWSQVIKKKPALVLLDVMLPDSSGIELCQRLKKNHPEIPILMMSALGQSSDRIKGLRSGADDYITKPFNLEELLLKVNKIIKLYQSQSTTIESASSVSLGSIQYNKRNYTLELNGELLYLTAKEAELLDYLLTHKNTAVRREDLIVHLWGLDHNSNPRTIDNYVSNLRKFIQKDPNKVIDLKSIRGIGYMITSTNITS